MLKYIVNNVKCRKMLYTLTRKFNFKCYCICQQAAVSSETF